MHQFYFKKHLENNVNGKYTRMLHTVPRKSWEQHSKKHQF